MGLKTYFHICFLHFDISDPAFLFFGEFFHLCSSILKRFCNQKHWSWRDHWYWKKKFFNMLLQPSCSIFKYLYRFDFFSLMINGKIKLKQSIFLVIFFVGKFTGSFLQKLSQATISFWISSFVGFFREKYVSQSVRHFHWSWYRL